MAEPLVVRAEILAGDRKIIAYTSGVTAGSVVVRTHETVAAGATVKLSLSLGRLLPTLDLDARVIGHAAGSGHGYLPALTLETLPGPNDRLAAVTGALGAAAAPRDCRVLVVEDSEFMRCCIQAAAERADQRHVRVVVDGTESAERALELLAAHRHDLVLVDLYLPGAMDGAALVRELRARAPAGRPGALPVIGFSIGGPAAREAFLAAGADLFLDKPMMTRDVLATLARLVMLVPGGASG